MGEILRDRLVPFECVKTVTTPNQGPLNGVGATKLLGVVLHATAGSDKGAVNWMSNPTAQVSCQVHIDRDGTTVRMVPDNRRAWHAGRSEWKGIEDVNSITLGWEIGNLNNGVEPYTDLQYGVLAQMAAHYLRQGLELGDFVGGPGLTKDYTSHAAIARPVGRKNDPFAFDWDRFRIETLARMQGTTPTDVVTSIPLVVWSNFFNDYLFVVDYVSDTNWKFVRRGAFLPGSDYVQRAQTPLSRMPRDV